MRTGPKELMQEDRKAFEAAGRLLGVDCVREVPPFADPAHVEEWEVRQYAGNY